MEHYDDYLMHYGIKGMKWGIRRTPAQLGHTVAKGVNVVKTYMNNTIKVYKKRSSLRKAQQARKDKSKLVAKEKKLNTKVAKTQKKYELVQKKEQMEATKVYNKQLKAAIFKMNHPHLTKIIDKRQTNKIAKNEAKAARNEVKAVRAAEVKDALRRAAIQGVSNAVSNQIATGVNACVKTHFTKIANDPAVSEGKKTFAKFMGADINKAESNSRHINKPIYEMSDKELSRFNARYKAEKTAYDNMQEATGHKSSSTKLRK